MLNGAYEFDEERPTREDDFGERLHRDVCLFFGCPDVDAAYSEFTTRDVVIDRSPEVAPYGMKQMYFKDRTVSDSVSSGRRP